MSKKQNNLTSQALLEMSNIKSAIKEESRNTLKDLLAEAVKTALRESSLEDEDSDDDMEIEDPTEDNEKGEKKMAAKRKPSNDDLSENGNPMEQQVPEGPAMGGQPEEVPAEGATENAPQPAMDGEGEDEWSQFDKYQTGEEGTYDLTSEKDFGTVLKVYKLLNNDEEIVVKKDGDKVQLQDNETGTEYIIDLGDGEEAPEAAAMPQEDGEEMQDAELNESSMLEFDDENDLSDEEMSALDGDYDQEGNEFGNGLDDLDDSEAYNDDFDPALSDGGLYSDDDDIAGFGTEDFMYDDLYENKKANKNSTRKSMKEGKNKKKEVLFEVDLGYTDNYQDKDPIKGLSNNEPSKSGRSWHKGVPTGTEKPWAGETKTKGDPFKKTEKVEGSVNEEEMVDETPVEEATNVGGAVQQRTSDKSHIPANRKGNTPEVTRHASTSEDGYIEKLEESLNKIKKENKVLKEGIKELRKGLNEAHVVNVNLGKITKLFLENTTTVEEKREIVNRFASEAKTPEQSMALYESISKQLNSKCGEKKAINEQSMKADSTTINENRNNAPAEFSGMIDLMKRMGNY